jgi:hypothetical protein
MQELRCPSVITRVVTVTGGTFDMHLPNREIRGRINTAEKVEVCGKIGDSMERYGLS